MSSDARRALERELGGRAPGGLKTLDDEELAHLAKLLHDAKQRQLAQLETAIDEALGIVPRLVRGPVRKVLFG